MMLDFVVMGVPRSGTTGVVRALNLHPEIMCGDEYLPNLSIAAKYDVPAVFEDQNIRRPHAEATRALFVEKKSTARIFGDKNPRYFFHLRGLSNCKKVCIYRRRMGFWPSWDARANDPSDEHWDRGQIGFFGALELVCLLAELTDLQSNGEVLLVDYDGLYFEDPGAIQHVYAYLEAAPNTIATTAFRSSLFASRRSNRAQLSDDARRAYDYLQLGDLEHEMFMRPVLTNTQVANTLREYCSASPALAASLIDAFIPNMRVAELAYFIGAKELRDALIKLRVNSRALHALDNDKQLAGCLSRDLSRLEHDNHHRADAQPTVND